MKFLEPPIVPVLSSLPTAGTEGRIAMLDSSDHLYYDNGTAWVDIGPAGSDTQVQFNDGGVIGADSDFTYDKSSNVLTVNTIQLAKGGGTNSLRLGGSASSATTNSSHAFGARATATANGAIAIGDQGVASAANAIAIGNDQTVTGPGAIGIGGNNNGNAGASGDNSIFISGIGGSATHISSIAIGTGADSKQDFGIAVGVDSLVDSSIAEDGGIAIGGDATSTAQDAIAIGQFAESDFANSLALGANTIATATNQCCIGFHINKIRLVPDSSANSAAILDFTSINGGDKTFTFPNLTGTLVVTASSVTSITGDLNVSSKIRVAEISAPSTPSSGFGYLYEKSDNKLYFKNDAGTEFDLTATGSGLSRTVVVTSGSITLGSASQTDYVYFVAGAHTMSMPAAAGNTNRYTIKNNHSANITVDTAGAENIEGAASLQLAPQEAIDVISDGTNWYVM